MCSSPAAAQNLRDLARLRRVRDRIHREHSRPLDVEALARGANMSAGTSAADYGWAGSPSAPPTMRPRPSS